MTAPLSGIDSLGDLRGLRALVRVDFNVPLDGGRVTDDRRVVRSLPTIRRLLAAGARVVLMSHLGRPKGVPDPALSMAPVAECLGKHLGRPVTVLDDCIGPEVEAAVSALGEGGVALLENLRFHAGEKKNDPGFAAALARLGDVYVNDAFGTAHRAHASVVGVAELLPAAAGELLRTEIETLSAVRDAPSHPLVLILGGAKVADKIPLIRNFLHAPPERAADRVLIGGGMAYTFLRSKGMATGASRLEEEFLDTSREILEDARGKDVRILLPVDHVCAPSIDRDAEAAVVEGEIADDLMGLDIGPATAKDFRAAVEGAGTVIWNGPMGVFEKEAFREGSRAVGEAVADLGDRALRVVGGGDTAAAAESLGLSDRIGHVSTGGGAALEFLGGVDLPGVEVLIRKSVGGAD